jgi:pyruvate dehydrogenase E2 component (dihydrolipoamide acetyltransferase)
MSPELFEFPFPDIGEGLSEGKVLELKARPGERLKQGQTLAVVETDKVVAEIPSPRDGTLVRFQVAEGEIIRVGQVLATIRVEESSTPERSLVGELEASDSSVLPPSREGRAASADAGAGSTGPTPGAGAVPGTGRPAAASPVARKLAASRGIDLGSIRGSGPGGRVLRRDVADAPASVPPGAGPPSETAAGPAAAGRVQPLSTLRRALAANMEKSNAIPSAVIHELVAVEELVRLRRELNEGRGGESREPRISFLPFFVRFAALALREYPLLNAAYHPESQQVELFAEVNIGVAVDSEEGLQVPVLRRADTLPLPAIQAEVDRLAAAARGRSLQLEELRGGTFTLSNYGAFAGLWGRPLILPPQVGILGVGRIHDQPAVRAGAWQAVPHLPLSLVFDHRVLDGMYAAGFLRRFMELAERPQELLLF